MLIFYDPTAPAPWPVKQVIDDHVESVYVRDDGRLVDLRQPGLQCLELDTGTAASLMPYRRLLHECTIEVINGQVALNLPEHPVRQPPRPAFVPPGIRHRARELAQLMNPMEAPPPIKVFDMARREGGAPPRPKPQRPIDNRDNASPQAAP